MIKNINKKTFALILIIVSMAFLFSACSKKQSAAKIKYIRQIEQWHKKRIANLKKENGWLNLVGLFWLKEGTNKFGSDKSNDIIFPEGTPKFIGYFILNNGNVKVKINNGLNVKNDDKIIHETELKNDLSGNPTILSYKSFRWFIIKRSDRYGVRLRNLEAPLVKNFKGIDYYPINPEWKVQAIFEKYQDPKILYIPTIIGTVEKDTSYGILKFRLNGKEYHLNPIEEDNRFFVIFADKTSGVETYGGGRFLYVPKPASSGKTVIDFNKAYNPPCAFTKFATCPLPPKDNYLKLEITAGEKNYGHGH